MHSPLAVMLRGGPAARGLIINISRRKERINVYIVHQMCTQLVVGLCQRDDRSRCHTFRDICERNREDATKNWWNEKNRNPAAQQNTCHDGIGESDDFPPNCFSLLLIQNGRQSSNKKTLGDILFYFLGQKRRLVSG